MLLYHAELRRRDRAKADLAEAVACGYGGIRGGDEGNAAMQRFLEALRRD